MKRGHLSQYFDGIAAKRLTTVEINPERSHQHEFQGVSKMREILGTPAEKVTFPARFVYFGSHEDNRESINSFVTWSDVRRGKPNRSPEYHLYYGAEAELVVHMAVAGDLLLVCRKENSSELLIVLAAAGSTVESQLSWLFDLPLESLERAVVKEISGKEDRETGYAVRYILEALDIAVDETDDDWLDRMLGLFSDKLPPTAVFSEFARQTLTEVDPISEPDATLLAWMEHEERLFRTLERHIVGKRISKGFLTVENKPDVDEFVQFSLSVQNRRKARVGRALENHLEILFQMNQLRFAHGAQTENRAKPDFLFPGVAEYRNMEFSADLLSILGVKSTCKDRWRQVLSEARRIETKHLLTLEPGISENQTEEMQANNLKLVIPADIHPTYKQKQQEWLMSIQDFILMTKKNQSRAI